MLELTTENLAAYLDRHWRIDGICQIEELSGGVSNVVFRVKTLENWYVIKQSRAQLRTADPWFSDLSRILREIDAMRLLGPRLKPGVVPIVHYCDDDNYAFVMSHAAHAARDWRTVLLEGIVDPRLGKPVGRILGQVHQATAGRESDMASLRDKTVFEQLRVTPFYRRTAERRPEFAPALNALIQDLSVKSICLCHGDFSPKNLLLDESQGSFTLVDYETAHLGDPAFDLGFFLSHLFLKALMHPDRCSDFRSLLAGFWLGYRETFKFVPFDMLVQNGITHLGACLLARVDGTSPAPYLTDLKRKDAARRLAKHIVLGKRVDWTEVVDLLERECAAL